MKAVAIYGSAGTGKTTTLVQLIDGLVSRGYAADSIGYFSFTRAAVGEMLKRLGLSSSNLVCTLHSMCFQHLGLSKESVVDHGLLTKFGKEYGYEFSKTKDRALGDMYLATLSLMKHKRLTIDSLSSNMVMVPRGRLMEFQERYEGFKKRYYLLDFDDMLMKYVNEAPAHVAKVLFVDEAQDLSPLQWDVVRAFIRAGGIELAVVAGDDDQAIYEWSGANPHGIVEFEKEFDARRMVLDVGYRLPRSVHAFSQRVIDGVVNRVPKTVSPRDADGEVIGISELTPRVLAGMSSPLILARTNLIKRRVEARLTQLRIPYTNREKDSPWENATARALRALMKYDRGDALDKAELRLLKRKVDDSTWNKIDGGEPLGVEPWKVMDIKPKWVDFYRSFDVDEPIDVTVSTIHASKGSEAADVVLCDAISHVVAQMAHMNPDAERRVWYVGATRARERLFVLRDLTLGDRYGI